MMLCELYFFGQQSGLTQLCIHMIQAVYPLLIHGNKKPSRGLPAFIFQNSKPGCGLRKMVVDAIYMFETELGFQKADPEVESSLPRNTHQNLLNFAAELTRTAQEYLAKKVCYVWRFDSLHYGSQKISEPEHKIWQARHFKNMKSMKAAAAATEKECQEHASQLLEATLRQIEEERQQQAAAGQEQKVLDPSTSAITASEV